MTRNDSIKNLYFTHQSGTSPRSSTLSEEIDAMTHNSSIAECLLQISEAYSTVPGEYMRQDAFRKASIRVRNHPIPVMTYSDAIAIRGVGESCANNIAEYVRSKRMPRLDAMLNDRVAAVAQMKRIWGVGAKKATELVKQGYRELVDLRKLSLEEQRTLLSESSMIALKYCEDL